MCFPEIQTIACDRFYLFFNFFHDTACTWDLSSLTRVQTRAPTCIGGRSLNHWTTCEVSADLLCKDFQLLCPWGWCWRERQFMMPGGWVLTLEHLNMFPAHFIFLSQVLRVLNKKVKSLSRIRLLVTPVNCSPPGSSIHGIA